MEIPDSLSTTDRQTGSHLALRLCGLLRASALDVTYHRAQGEWVYYREPDGREIEVLDLVGGYGVLILGHGHPELIAEAKRQLLSGRPVHVQGSLRHFAARLAEALSERAQGDYRVVFGNSGAEAVETALKHAMLETASRVFIALENAFHGKTLGALQLTANPTHREPFTLPGLRVLRVRPNDLDHLQAVFDRAADIAGLIYEPIQGEGGVRPLDPSFVQHAARLCAARNVPLIADECQTGIGRTGRFLASELLGVQPDYVLLSKALGGGLAKLSALLVRRERYAEQFDLKHTSTFAADEFSSAIGLKVLELVDAAAVERCREQGDRLLKQLRDLQGRYPDVLADVRGSGLMIGVEFARPTTSSSYILRYLAAQEQLLPCLAGYLLNLHRVRVAATLSDPFTLRMQPPLDLSQRAIERMLGGLEDLCERIHNGDGVGLTRYLAGPVRSAGEQPAVLLPEWRPCSYRPTELPARSAGREPVRVAWLCHLIDADDLISLEPDFQSLNRSQREDWIDRTGPLAAPVLMNVVDVRSRDGTAVRLHPIMLPVTSRWMKKWIDRRQFRPLTKLVQKGVDMARSLDCDIVSLGQYTSIATLNGTTLRDSGIGLTTGNSYAIALALDAIRRAERERGIVPRDAVLAIVGAAGNIGRACTEILAPEYRRVLLVGTERSASLERLRQLAGRLAGAKVVTHLTAITEADVVVAAASAVDGPLKPHHFAPDAIVCDLSVPATVDPRVHAMREDLLIIKGGIARLPHGEDLGIVGFPLPPGCTYGCMAEGMLLGLEGVTDSTFTGSLRAEHVLQAQTMADRHGFELADYKSSCVLGSERREKVCA